MAMQIIVVLLMVLVNVWMGLMASTVFVSQVTQEQAVRYFY